MSESLESGRASAGSKQYPLGGLFRDLWKGERGATPSTEFSREVRIFLVDFFLTTRPEALLVRVGELDLERVCPRLSLGKTTSYRI